jgi:tetratricopeptide (TPR) repeat protein
MLTEAAATELFTTRARQVKPGFVPDGSVSEVCRRLDRLPLALELASTRVKLMSTSEMLSRFDRRLALLSAGRRDLPARQATMRAALDWSYDLLPDEEQRVFRALSVFAASFELAAAEAVCGAGLDVLQSLVDKSLLRLGESGRFFLLETTHEYGRDRAEELGETSELSRRHAVWFLDLARGADRELRTSDQSVWLERLWADAENFRAVLRWALAEDVPRGLELADTLQRVWGMHGRNAELCRWYEEALAAGGVPPARRAASLSSYAAALLQCDLLTEAETASRESVAVHRSLGDKTGEAESLNQLSSVRWAQGATDDAIALRTETLTIYRDAGDRPGLARSLHLLGESVRDAGDLDRGRELLAEAAATDMELGDRRSAMTSLHSLGDLELDARDPERAAAQYREALAICRELDDERSEAYCLAGLACVAQLEGDQRKARRLWADTIGIEERIGQRLLAKERARYEAILAGPTETS